MKAILAHDKNFGIGKDNSLPWKHNKKDMQHFVDVTRGATVVMGRKTFESLGCKPLPKRRNIVLSTQDLSYEGVEVMLLEDFLNNEDLKRDAIIIGGADIYEKTFEFCEEIFVTVFEDYYECDTHINSNYFYGMNQETLYQDEIITIGKLTKTKS